VSGSGWPKPDPLSTHSLLCMTVDQDPDGSGSIQRSRSVSLIRIHQIRGYRPGFHWFFCFLSVSWCSLLYTPLILANWTFCMPKFLLKFQVFLLYVFYYFLGILCYFSKKKLNKNMCLLIGANLCPFRCFFGVSHAMLVPILCHVSLILNAHFLWYFHLFVKFDLWLLICDISICLLNLIFDYYFVIFPFVC